MFYSTTSWFQKATLAIGIGTTLYVLFKDLVRDQEAKSESKSRKKVMILVDETTSEEDIKKWSDYDLFLASRSTLLSKHTSRLESYVSHPSKALRCDDPDSILTFLKHLDINILVWNAHWSSERLKTQCENLVYILVE
ncbi:hypothetical protein POMI540_1245 [Schizosaccharomyces pombe]|uniref:Uncharacterized protein C57A7.15c n=1 Tax=Schizosaccharomyces pombe (strain 972 / ATCC 24843) TaxID=284812 RepID=YDMO_SCHPO|nr:uncharacterized protein SPAC57A7.15c [Schizosaccharomyces pombe]C6Y4B2.1 RecName: Full=Uncharacterized protein C57A7.15c [Schizosaccharomyces pombe 972h-]CBA11494.1 sequence orphan [Schizosaccharomyces pombe]|eukprot:NP_001343069.1 uncharacterized protein SPAC57A7.15c [Schizosaccharomyces pombe]